MCGCVEIKTGLGRKIYISDYFNNDSSFVFSENVALVVLILVVLVLVVLVAILVPT